MIKKGTLTDRNQASGSQLKKLLSVDADGGHKVDDIPKIEYGGEKGWRRACTHNGKYLE